MRNRQIAWAVVSAATVLILSVLAWRMLMPPGAVSAEPGHPMPSSLATEKPSARPAPRGEDAACTVADETTAEESVSRTGEEREAEEEKLVDSFDNLVDKWMEPAKKGVTMADVDGFAKAFRRVPKKRQDECIHRAMNLIPDANVMLLAGILMDKSADKKIVETVFHDVLNRDEDVKKPILQEIFKDKSHPCWTDTAWILDVTGELPKAK